MDDCLCTVLRPKRNSEACFNITPPPPPFPLKKKKENNTNILYCLLYDVGGFLVIIWFDNVYKYVISYWESPAHNFPKYPQQGAYTICVTVSNFKQSTKLF